MSCLPSLLLLLLLSLLSHNMQHQQIDPSLYSNVQVLVGSSGGGCRTIQAEKELIWLSQHFENVPDLELKGQMEFRTAGIADIIFSFALAVV